jgi:cytochrome c biogenesis protein
MIENTKCECGHQNHVGTVLCEACGNPLFEEGDNPTELLEMRYDGVARRSQRKNPNVIDRVWNFFSSVKIAVYLILITLIAASLGTIYPQENTFVGIDPELYYRDQYGWTGYVYWFLGLSRIYDSWWFVGLLVMIGTSLVVCSIDRVLPLYRALSRQKVAKHPNFLARQRVVFRYQLHSTNEQEVAQWTERFAGILKKQWYRVFTEQGALMAEKNRFSRWGPYINHIGLIILLLAILLRSVPGWNMDEHYTFPEGEVVPIPGTNYYLKNEKFTAEFYDEDKLAEHQRQRGDVVASLYETKAILYTCEAKCNDPLVEPKLKEVKRHNIRVNSPLNYQGFMAYQVHYEFTPKLLAVNVSVVERQTGKRYDKFRLDMDKPGNQFQSGPYTLELKNYYRDFGQDENGRPVNKSSQTRTPAFIFLMKGPGLAPDGDIFIYFAKDVDKQTFRQDELNGELAKQVDINAASMDDVELSLYTSYLNIRVDNALPYIFAGLFIFLIGVIMGMYWQHRRIWLRIDGNQLLLAAHTNKNWYSMRQDVQKALAKMGIEVELQDLNNKGGNSKQHANS